MSVVLHLLLFSLMIHFLVVCHFVFRVLTLSEGLIALSLHLCKV